MLPGHDSVPYANIITLQRPGALQNTVHNRLMQADPKAQEISWDTLEKKATTY